MAEVEEVEASDELGVQKGLILSGKHEHHLDEGGHLGKAGPIPQELDGALAPRTRDEEGAVDVAGGMEVFQDVYEDFGREVRGG